MARSPPICWRHRDRTPPRANGRAGAQTEEEGRVFQLVRRIVCPLHQRHIDGILWPKAHGVTGIDYQMVGIMLKPASAPGVFSHLVRAGLKPVAHQTRKFKNEPGVICCEPQQSLLFVAEMTGQRHSDTVVDQCL